MKKAFLILQQMGLISGLVLRGVAPHSGLLKRAFPVQTDLAAFSDQNLQVIDITNRDNPATVALLKLL